MSVRVIRVLTDDLDGTDADDTIRFAMDGIEYEIDLSLPNANEFRAVVQKYVDAGRRVGKMPGSGSRGPKVPVPGRSQSSWMERAAAPAATHATYDPAAREERARVREWARNHGVQVPDRGRISQDVLDAYAADDPTRMTKYTGAAAPAAPVAPPPPPVQPAANGSSSNGNGDSRSVPAAAFQPAGVTRE